MLAVYVAQVFPDLPELSTLLLIVIFIAHFCMVLSGSVEMFNLIFFFLIIMGETVSNNLLVVLMFRWIIYPNKMALVFKFVVKTTTRYGLLFRAPVFLEVVTLCISLVVVTLCISLEVVTLCISLVVVTLCISLVVVTLCISLVVVTLCISLVVVTLCISLVVVTLCISLVVLKLNSVKLPQA